MKRKVDVRIAPNIVSRYQRIIDYYFEGDRKAFSDYIGIDECSFVFLFNEKERNTHFPTLDKHIIKALPQINIRWLWFEEGTMIN